MHFVLKNSSKYNKVITHLSIWTVLCVFGCILLGFVFLPIASAFYAALLVYENPSKRFVSYVLPPILFTVNFFIRTAFSFEAVAYVISGIVIYLAATRKGSKGECAFWLVLTTAVMILLSLIFFAFESTGNFGLVALKQFYSNLYLNIKNSFISYLTTKEIELSGGIFQFAYNQIEAESIFNELLIFTAPLLIVVSFLISGLALKFFSAIVNRYSGEESNIYLWNFCASNPVTYFYILVSILCMLVSFDGSVFVYTLISLNTVLSAVFAYLGVKFIYYFLLSRGRSAMFSVTLIIIVSVLLSSYVVQIFSYIGVIFNLVANKVYARLK